MTVAHPRTHVDLARMVFKVAARVGARELLPVVAASGERPVVVAVGTDSVADVAQKVAAHGGANVCLFADGQVHVFGWEPQQADHDFTTDSSDEEASPQRVHGSTTMSMLLTLATDCHDSGQRIALHVEANGVEAEIPPVQSYAAA